ncbi:unnamed protein product [Rotaria sp. Silwood1]|nr:unnamed protein product [Rotaria sp. Silwood1]CAF1387926.1 unnamed protein product [Rotaria sp. Silwood1]CAF3590978.1 unnamed protein product [Rotaria sp. Silwood1]CAF4666339.1 unnamed protein product [Rotaria sp. Silwood1]
MTIQIRRRFRRCCLGRTAIYLLISFAISSTAICSYNFYLNILSEQRNEKFKLFIIDEKDLNDGQIEPTKNMQLLHEDYFNITNLACRYPKLTINNPEIWKYLDPVTKSQPDCEKSTNWVYVDNGTFRLSQQALQKHGPIVCAYRPILRSKDDFTTMEGARLFPVVDKMPLVSDFFRADCRARDGSIYSNIHSGIMFDAGLHMRHIWNPMVKTHLGYNVLMFGFDSVSRMTFMRFLPKTFSYLIKELGGVVLKGYNIVGDGTPAALLPILTGQTEQELPEARRGHTGAETVDRFPWIWKKFKDNGYITQWAEDLQVVGTFQMRLKGFHEPPVDHYGRPFYLVAESMRTSKPYCFGSITRFQSMLNWIRDLFEMYPSQPKFSFVFHSQYSHDSNNALPYADDELVEFLKLMHKRGYFDNTMLILMTDHGARFSSLRKTYQGKLEERLPFMSIRMPKKFQDEYPHLMYNLRLNSHRLTTPFDLHETFEHLFEFRSSDSYQSKSNRSYSLFQLIPENRTCLHADVEQHWCACLNWNHISIDEPVIKEFGQQAVEFLNKFVSDSKNQCAKLNLYRIHKANQLETNEHLLKFVDSSDKDGRVPRFRNNTLTNNLIKNLTVNQTKYYQVQFETIPGHALFELTAEYNPLNDTFHMRKKRLSRMNKYGKTSACIAYKRPEFREICYCSNLLNRTHKFTTAVFVDAVISNEKKSIKLEHTVAKRSSFHR